MYLFLIECDSSNSLGGSCLRDLKNMSNHIHSDKIFVFTTNPINTNGFPEKTEFFNLDVNNLKKCIAKVNDHSTVMTLISGHGYQMKDRSGDELDGMDEYIKTSNSIILDDDLRNIFILPLSKKQNIKFIGLIDTCHSGTMFDLDFRYKKGSWFKDTNRDLISINAISIGACLDNQLDNCDIGNIGFGGALTVHLIDNNLVKYLLKGEEIYVFNKLEKIFKNLRQTPVLQKCKILK